MGTVGNILFSWACDAITKPQFQQLTPSNLCIQDPQLCNIFPPSPKSLLQIHATHMTFVPIFLFTRSIPFMELCSLTNKPVSLEAYDTFILTVSNTIINFSIQLNSHT